MALFDADGKIIPSGITKNELFTTPIPWSNLIGYYPMSNASFW